MSARPSHHRCGICNGAWVPYGGPSACPPCRAALDRIKELDHGRDGPAPPVDGHEERIARLAERAAQKLPLFTDRR